MGTASKKKYIYEYLDYSEGALKSAQKRIKEAKERKNDYACLECGYKFLNWRQRKNVELGKHRIIYIHQEGALDIDKDVKCCGICGKEKEIAHMRYFDYFSIA